MTRQNGTSHETIVLRFRAVAAELATLLDEAQGEINERAAGSITFHWGPDGMRWELLVRGAKRPRLTDSEVRVLDCRE